MKLDRMLEEMKDLHRELFGRPAPEVPEESWLPLPHGFDPVETIAAELEHIRGIYRQVGTTTAPPNWLPLTDCFVTPEAFVVQLETPGVAREDIEVLVSDGECVVRGERKRPSDDLHPIATERVSGRFERRFPLPVGIRDDAVEAKSRDGVLELRFPREAVKPIERRTVAVT
jgi:HSP20 family protein